MATPKEDSEKMVKVILILKPTQQIPNSTLWSVTHKDKRMEVPSDFVQYYCKTLFEASTSFLQDEVKDFKIESM